MTFVKSTKGFTLIELVMVIVILGILATVAVPKFQDLSADARNAVVSGIIGSVQSGVSIWHTQNLVSTPSTGGAAATSGYPLDLDDLANASVDSLFKFVLAPSLLAESQWSKSSAAATDGGSATYNYNADASNPVQVSYSNASGRIVRVNQ